MPRGVSSGLSRGRSSPGRSGKRDAGGSITCSGPPLRMRKRSRWQSVHVTARAPLNRLPFFGQKPHWRVCFVAGTVSLPRLRGTKFLNFLFSAL